MTPETAIALKIIEITLTEGVPALMRILNGLNTSNPTLADIESLHDKVKPLSQTTFKG